MLSYRGARRLAGSRSCRPFLLALPLNLCLLGLPSGICPSPFFRDPVEQRLPTVLGDESTGGRSG